MLLAHDAELLPAHPAAGKVHSLGLQSFPGSPGATETLITHPASMTHSQFSPAAHERIGIGEGLSGLTAGFEELVDIVRKPKVSLGPVCGSEVQA